jgi:hypothetical protein
MVTKILWWLNCDHIYIVDVHNLGSNNVLLPGLNINDIVMLMSLIKE